jgi:hypothetical protein
MSIRYSLLAHFIFLTSNKMTPAQVTIIPLNVTDSNRINLYINWNYSEDHELFVTTRTMIKSSILI